MHSQYLSSLSTTEKEDLKKRLFDSQKGKCFICEDPVNLTLHKDSLQIDHIIPIREKGKDGPENFALTHGVCNESKQASNLRVARLLARFEKIKKKAAEEKRDSATLSDVLRAYNGCKFNFNISSSDGKVNYSFPEVGDNTIYQSQIFVDPLSKQKSFFAEVPLEYLYHDTNINPRGIGTNLRKLVEEFFKGRPQLHVALSRLDSSNGQNKIMVFDGQHKAAAQILLGTKKLPVRIFIDADVDLLLTTNTNAGDTLRQVAFDKSIKRRLGHSLFTDRIARYQKEHSRKEDDYSFSERDLVNYFKGESREMKRYILDAVRDGVTQDGDNALREYIDLAGRAKEKPISYSTIDKTFYSFFIYQGLLETNLDYKADIGENPRELERRQLVMLMNIIAKEIYEGKFDFNLGTHRIENKIQQGEDVPEPHLVAYRMSKEEVIYNWLKYIKSIIQSHFLLMGKHIEDDKLFQEPFPEQLWVNIEHFVRNLRGLPIWVNKELSATVFGGKQNYDYWEHIFKTGKTTQGITVMSTGLDYMQMIRV